MLAVFGMLALETEGITSIGSCQEMATLQSGEPLPWDGCPLDILGESRQVEKAAPHVKATCHSKAPRGLGDALPWDHCPVGLLGESREWLIVKSVSVGESTEITQKDATNSAATASKLVKPGMVVEINKKSWRVIDAGSGYVALIEGPEPYEGAIPSSSVCKAVDNGVAGEKNAQDFSSILLITAFFSLQD